jgi:uncharacterized protein (TIGR03435 family)
MTNRILPTLTPARKLLLASAGIAAVAVPICIGIVNAPRMRAQSQTGAAPLTFEVASIKPADPDVRGMRFHRTPGGGLSATGVTLKTLIEFTYDVRDFQISGGPRWLRTDRFDIVAKPDRPEVEPGDLNQATDVQQRLIWERWRLRLRALLAERFQLSVHSETEERPVYLLVLAKNGHKLRDSTEDRGIRRNLGEITGMGTTIEKFAVVLSGTLARPVLDRTGLTGKYDFKLEWTEESRGPMGKGGPGEMPPDPNPPDPSGPSIFSAIQQQLGLKLESQKGPVEIIVIDRAEKPSAN